MTKIASEDAEVEASSIARAKHRSGIELVGDANARSNILEVLINIHGSVEWPSTRNANCAGREVGEAALALHR